MTVQILVYFHINVFLETFLGSALQSQYSTYIARQKIH